MPSKLGAEMLVTVIVCTYNPSKDQFTRTLEALSNQNLTRSNWELILVDNNSDTPLEQEYHLEWHPHARWVHEPIQGKPNALMRGIANAQGSLIITVDDDNVLASDYLSTAVRIHTDNPHLGAFGSGATQAAYKIPPPPWLGSNIVGYLAIRQVNQAMVYETIQEENCRPWGLGLCVTRRVALAYIRACTNILSRHPYLTGRKATILDDDLFSLCAVEARLKYGIFPELRVKNIVSPSRMDFGYIASLAYDHGYSHAHFARFSGKSLLNPTRIGSVRTAIMLFLKGKFKLAFEEASHIVHHFKHSRKERILRINKANGWKDAVSILG